jgi:hypothetical protein
VHRVQSLRATECLLHSETLRSRLSPQRIETKEDRPDTSVQIFSSISHETRSPKSSFLLPIRFLLSSLFFFYLQQCFCLCQLEWGERGSRIPDVTKEAAGNGAAMGATDAPGTKAVPATGSSLVPETGLGVSTRGVDSARWTGRNDEGRWTRQVYEVEPVAWDWAWRLASFGYRICIWKRGVQSSSSIEEVGKKYYHSYWPR